MSNDPLTSAPLPSRADAVSVAAIMLTLNQRDVTLRALASLGGDDRQAVWMLIWDNGSTDGTADAVREHAPWAHVHRSPTNLGVASGRNAAAALAIQMRSPTHLLFVDNDLVFTPGFVRGLLEPFAHDPALGQTQAKLRFLHAPQRINDGGGCRIRFWSGQTKPVGCGEVDRGQYDMAAPCISCGGAMMVRSDVFRVLGGFDPAFDPFGPEDLDFSLRLQKRGFRALYVPKAMAYHEVSHTFGNGRYTQEYARLKAQHWLRFLRRHASPIEKVGFAMLGVPLIAGRMMIREGRRGNPGALVGSAVGLLTNLFRSRND